MNSLSKQTGVQQDKLMEVTVKQLVEMASQTPEEQWNIDGHGFSQLVICGQVVGIEAKQNRQVLLVEDSTYPGLQLQMYGKQGDSREEMLDKLQYEEYMYVRAVVVVKQFQNKVIYLAQAIKKVTFNQYLHHRYMVLLGHQQRKHGYKPTNHNNNNNNTNNNNNNNNNNNDQIAIFMNDGQLEDQNKIWKSLQHMQEQKQSNQLVLHEVQQTLNKYINKNYLMDQLMLLEENGFINLETQHILLLG